MLELTARARELLSQNNVEIQLIVEIDGIDMVFGVSPVKSLWKVGDANIRIGDPNLFIGGIVTNPNSKNLIDPSASTKTISQQLEIERGVSSVSNVKVRILDENDFATALFSPGPTDDILGRGCTLYIALTGASHPEDSIRIFDGMIDDCVFGPGYADLNISHPEQFKRQAIFPKWESELLTTLPSSTNAPSATTINVASASDLIALPTAHGAFTYIKLDQEVLYFSAINKELSTLSGLVSRNMFQTPKLTHDINDQIESFYFFKRNPIDLALMLLCSRKPNESQYYVTDIDVTAIATIPSGDYKARLRCDSNIITKYNIQVGDTISIGASGSGTHDPANFKTVVVKNIVIDGLNADLFSDSVGFVNDSVNVYTFSAVSKWNLLPDGCGISNRYIDFEGFDSIKSIHGAELTDCEIFLKDTIEDTKEFIDLEILKPQGLYSLPRKGRISIGKTVPPVANKETKVINERNVTNASSLRIGRSINRNFYNSVIYKYEEDPNEDKFLAGLITIDETSFNKIKVGSRPLTIEAKSLRKGPDTTKVIQSQTKRLLERYKFAAETIEVKVDFETGINIDVGDTAVCQFKNLKVSDITTGTRDFAPRLMEVVNKSLNITRGETTLTLANTIFEVDGRYATISPSSIIDAGSTTTMLKLKKSFSRKNETNEKGKWEQYTGQRIIVRTEDWSTIHETTIVSLDELTDSIVVNPPLPTAPGQGLIIESPKYDDTTHLEMSFWKRLHTYLNPTVEVVSGISETKITVDPLDLNKFIVGSVIVIHDPGYVNKSAEVSVKEINEVTNELTLSQVLGYVPDPGDQIDLIGFRDGGLPYRIV